MAENTIDLQSLDIKPQSPKYSYIGLDENNELVRTTISSNDDVDLSDWSVDNGDGFIKNRTHYAKFNNVLYFHKDNSKWISDEIEDTNALYLLPNDDSNSDYVLVTEEKIINNSTIFQTDNGNGTYRIIGSYPYYIEFVGNPSIGEKLESGVRFTWVHSQFIKSLNEVFIPDSIARMEEVDVLRDETLAIWENIENINLSDYYTKGEVDDIVNNIEIPEGGTSDGTIIIYAPVGEGYTEEMKAHNAAMIKRIKNNTVKTAYLRYPNHSYQNAVIYVPMAFGWEIGGDYGYLTGVCKYWYYGSLHYDYFALDMTEDGYVYKFEVEPMGGQSSGGGGYDSNPTFDSITVNGGAYFNSEIVMADNYDISEGIACAFKAGKTQSVDQWTRNIHTGTDGQGLRVCSSDEYGGTQYMAVDTDGNIYEGTTKLSDKYALKDTIGNINTILESI